MADENKKLVALNEDFPTEMAGLAELEEKTPESQSENSRLKKHEIAFFSSEQNKTFSLSPLKAKFLAALAENEYDLNKVNFPDYLIKKWQAEDFWTLVAERLLNYAKARELNQSVVDAYCLDVMFGRREASDSQLKALALAFRKLYGAKTAVVALPQNSGPIQFNFGEARPEPPPENPPEIQHSGA